MQQNSPHSLEGRIEPWWAGPIFCSIAAFVGGGVVRLVLGENPPTGLY